jgi:hypothetical protein
MFDTTTAINSQDLLAIFPNFDMFDSRLQKDLINYLIECIDLYYPFVYKYKEIMHYGFADFFKKQPQYKPFKTKICFAFVKKMHDSYGYIYDISQNQLYSIFLIQSIKETVFPD